MRIKSIILMLLAIVSLPATAQIFNFSLRTNNQQLIDEALVGAFIGINQKYELCDTVSNEHFGRDGKDYFSNIPFLGIATERGLMYPSVALRPWNCDGDFDEYKNRYKPIVTETGFSILNDSRSNRMSDIKSLSSGMMVSKHLSALSDSTITEKGLKIDSVPGMKNGWLIWVSSTSDSPELDSIRLTSIKKDIEVPVDGSCLHIDKPEIPEKVYGGIYVTPVRSSIGQITFTLIGVLVLDEKGWVLDFPFVKPQIEDKVLTPIKGAIGNAKLNPLKKKKK